MTRRGALAQNFMHPQSPRQNPLRRPHGWHASTEIQWIICDGVCGWQRHEPYPWATWPNPFPTRNPRSLRAGRD